ncbi:MAG: hypothetical protein V1839_04010 [archaeon]
MPQSNFSRSDTPNVHKTVRLPKSKHRPSYTFWSKPASHKPFVMQANVLNKIVVLFVLVLAMVGAFTVTKIAVGKMSGYSTAEFENRLLIRTQNTGVSSPPVQPSCTDLCTEVFCKDGNILVECKDTNGDGCMEMAETTCGISCEDKACNNVKEDFTLQTGDSIIQFLPTKIKLATINPDKTVTLEVGNDIYVFAEGDVDIIQGLSITVNSIGANSVTLNVKKV